MYHRGSFMDEWSNAVLTPTNNTLCCETCFKCACYVIPLFSLCLSAHLDRSNQPCILSAVLSQSLPSRCCMGVTIHNVTKSIIMTSHIPFSFYFVSTKSPAQILHFTLQPGSDGRQQCQSNMCSSGLTNAIYQVDHGFGGPVQRGDAIRAQCAGAHQHSRIS